MGNVPHYQGTLSMEEGTCPGERLKDDGWKCGKVNGRRASLESGAFFRNTEAISCALMPKYRTRRCCKSVHANTTEKGWKYMDVVSHNFVGCVHLYRFVSRIAEALSKAVQRTIML